MVLDILWTVIAQKVFVEANLTNVIFNHCAVFWFPQDPPSIAGDFNGRFFFELKDL